LVLSILAIADAVSPALHDHFQPERWRHIDLVLSAGDLPPDYLDFLCSSLNVPILYVRGNHDAAYSAEQYAGSDDVHGRLVTVKGLRIAGFEGSRWYNGGLHQLSERDMARLVRKVDRQVRRVGPPDIVLTHAPPKGCHDAQDVCHQGFACFRDAIDRWQPAFFVHGHMHAYTGRTRITRIGRTAVVNAYPFQILKVPESVPAEVSRVASWRLGMARRASAGARPDPDRPCHRISW
jgi:predicted phosphodiesterase